MIFNKLNIKKEPIFNKFVNIVGPQGVGKTSCATAIFLLDYKYHRKKRTQIANEFIHEINQFRKEKVPYIEQHLYFSNIAILLNSKKNIYTHSINLNHLSIPETELANYFPKGSIFFIQEADSEADSRDWRSLARGLIEFAKRFRHMNYTVILDMQISGNFDKKLRQLLTNIWFIYKSKPKRFLLFFKKYKWYLYDLQNQLNDFVKELANIGVNIKLNVLEKKTLSYSIKIFNHYDSFNSSPYFINGLKKYEFKKHILMNYSEDSIKNYCEEHPIIKES